MTTAPVFSNPDCVHAPLGLYSHTVSVPSGAELLFLSSQVGGGLDGSAGDTIAEQADQVFLNIVSLLSAHGLKASSIIKLTTLNGGGPERPACA